MASIYRIAKEVKHGRDGEWQLCFQYGMYEYDPAHDTDVPWELGYRFIWRRPTGQLQGARGQARLEPELITMLLGKAAEAGWYPNPPKVAPPAPRGASSTRGTNRAGDQ